MRLTLSGPSGSALYLPQMPRTPSLGTPPTHHSDANDRSNPATKRRFPASRCAVTTTIWLAPRPPAHSATASNSIFPNLKASLPLAVEFSTESPVAAGVWGKVQATICAVLRLPDPKFELVDDLGQPWSPAAAPAQMQRLGVSFASDSWRPDKLPWWQRLFRRRPAWFGDCPVCGHDWREHIPADGECGECRYEIEHEEPEAPSAACRTMPPVQARVNQG